MDANEDAGAADRSAAPLPDDVVAVRLDLSQAEAAQLRALGGSSWLRAQLAAAGGGTDPVRQDAASDCLLGLAGAMFPLPVSGSAVRCVDALRKQGMLEAAVTYDDAADGDGDRAIVVNITARGLAEIARLQRVAAG